MNNMASFLPLLIIMGIFILLGSRRQKKAMQATLALQESLRVGDKIIMTCGIQGVITDISDDIVSLEIAPGVVTTWSKMAVRDKITDELPSVEQVPILTDSDHLPSE